MKIPFLKKEKIPEVLREEKISIGDIIAPSAIEETRSHLRLGERLTRSFFIFSYPQYLSTAWLSPIINLDVPMDIALFIHPLETGRILRQLRKRVTEVQAEIGEREEKGLIRDPQLEAAYRNLEELRDKLISARERVFDLGLYLTIYGETEKELEDVEVILRSILEARLIYIKPALYRQKDGFICSGPYGLDLFAINTAMNTEPLSSIFPFVSFDLSSNEGILYGINQHNNSLVLFDRFNLENYNSVLFGKAGCGKSYAIKLEILRSLMQKIDVLVIDPENEYEFLADAVGGSFINISLTGPHHVNPFDLPKVREDERPEDVLRSNIINLVGLLRIMLGGLTAEEDAIIDTALTETYSAKDITPDSDHLLWGKELPYPLMSDFEEVLETMEGAESLVRRVRKFTKGTYAGFFNQPTNVSMEKNLIVFGIRNMEEELRQIAMYIILRHIWKTITSVLKKRILVVDEAWWLMQTEDGASFLYGTAKRARKYWLGLTTATQDVADFMKSDYGKPIIDNSSLGLLMKQSPAAIDFVKKTFKLTEEEKLRLLESQVGEGIFFAGTKHIALRVVASYAEDQIITTAPEEVVKIREARKRLKET